VYNDGNAAGEVRIYGPAGNSRWAVGYRDRATGIDVTAAVTGGGWTTPAVPARGYRWLVLSVTPKAGAPGNSQAAILVTAMSATDLSRRDAVKATTTCAPTYQPDGVIYNGSTYLGDGIYNTTGTGQGHALSLAAGRAATYTLQFYNDGNVAQTLRITGTAGHEHWGVRYVDYSTGADITAAVTGVGWVTPSLGPGAYRRIRLYVTPGPSVAIGASLSVLVTGTSTVNVAKKDTVKAVTSRK